MGFLDNLFNMADKKELKKFNRIVDSIDSLEPKFESMSDKDLKDMTNVFKDRLANGETLDDILPEAFAVVREASKRVLGMRHYRVQLIGGIVLHQGRIAEMKTRIELIVTNWQVQKMLDDNVTVDDLKQALVDGGVTDSKDKITGSDGRYEVETKDGDIFEIIIDENGNIKVNLKGEGSDEDNNPGGEKPEVTLEVNVTETTNNLIKIS